jgi:hypothetical protein
MSSALLIAAVLGASMIPARKPADSLGTEARRIVREARRAQEGDSLAAVAARWSVRLATDPADRSALLGLATAARLANDDSTALGLYHRLLGAPQPGVYAAYANLGIARIFFDRSALRAADSTAQSALALARASRDSSAEGEALLAVADARMDADARAGRAYLDSALRVLPPGQTDLAADARCRRARLGFRSGDPAFSRELAAGLAYAQQVEAPRAEAQCLRTAAVDRWTSGQEDSAVVLLRRAVALQRAARDRRALSFTLVFLADLFRDVGAYGESRAATNEALELARASRYVQGEAMAALQEGTLAYSLRDLPTAARAVDRAWTLYGSLGDSANQMNVRSWQANLARNAGDYPRAIRLTREVIAAARREQAVPWAIDMYRTLGDIELLAGDYRAAAAALDTSGLLIRTNHLGVWARKLDFQHARLALRRGDLDASERIFREYLRSVGRDEHLRRYEVESYLAEIRARRGDLAGAERDLSAAGDALDLWRAGLNDRDLRLFAFQASASDESDGNATIARVIAALAAGGRVSGAFDLAERRRARELGDRLVATLALENAGSAPGPTTVARTVTPDQLMEVLPEGTALLEYVTGPFGAPTTAFVLRRGRPPGSAILPRADSMAGPIARLVSLLAGGDSGGAATRALGQALVDPIMTALDGVTRLVIVPDGPLHRVPWDALRLRDGRRMVERFAVALAPSAGALAVIRRHPWPLPRKDSVRLLAFGDPTFDRMAPADADLFSTAGGLPRLPGSGDEARRVARYAAYPEVLLREQASAEYLRRASLTGFQVIHLATHALVDERAVGRTALALAPGAAGSGLVTAGELAHLRLRASLVVLSACRTAGGVVVDGEGMQGLTSPLLEAGARTVVATTWSVGDRQTVPFVDDFYAELARGRPAVEALQAAKLAAIRAGKPPRTWAAFVAVGDPMTVVPLTPARSRVLLWAMPGGLIVLGVGVSLVRRRRRAVTASRARRESAAGSGQ